MKGIGRSSVLVWELFWTAVTLLAAQTANAQFTFFESDHRADGSSHFALQWQDVAVVAIVVAGLVLAFMVARVRRVQRGRVSTEVGPVKIGGAEIGPVKFSGSVEGPNQARGSRRRRPKSKTEGGRGKEPPPSDAPHD